jgi:ABC-type antimicrobial peptide transport system, permease component
VNILTIPLRTMRKKWVKTLLLLLVFTLSVISIVSLNYVSRVVGESLEKKLTAWCQHPGHAQEREADGSYGGFSMGDMLMGVTDLRESEVEEKILSIGYRDRISVIAPKLVAMTKVDGVTVGVVGVRFEPGKGAERYWAMQGAFPAAENGILAGSKAAEKLGLAVGDSVELGGRSAVVSGVIGPTGSDDDSVLFAGMDFTQAVFGQADHVSFVEVSALCAGAPSTRSWPRSWKSSRTPKFRPCSPSSSSACIRFISWSTSSDREPGHSLHRLLHGRATMLSSVNERIKEIGLLRSLGFSRGGIFGIFCFEAVLIGMVAGGHRLFRRVRPQPQSPGPARHDQGGGGDHAPWPTWP